VDSGSFSVDELVCVKTKELQCTTLPKLVGNGTIIPGNKNSFSVGEKVTLKCSEGYEVKDGTAKDALCLRNEQFNVEEFTCVKISKNNCKDRQLQSNCQYWKRVGYCYKQFVSYMKDYCNETCGYCKDVKCTTLPTLVGNGTLLHEGKDSFSVGDKVTVKCSEGYEVKYKTAKEAICVDSGSFSVDELVCVKTKELQCTTLPKLVGNGTIIPGNKNSFSVGEKITLKCSKGYEVKNGTAKDALCLKNEQFNVDQFTCVKEQKYKIYWTKFYDRDNPSGTGDLESIKDLRDQYPGQICDNPIAVEGQLTNGSPISVSGNYVEMSPTTGLICQNSKQTQQLSKSCKDFKVRFLCIA